MIEYWLLHAHEHYTDIAERRQYCDELGEIVKAYAITAQTEWGVTGVPQVRFWNWDK